MQISANVPHFLLYFTQATHAGGISAPFLVICVTIQPHLVCHWPTGAELQNDVPDKLHIMVGLMVLLNDPGHCNINSEMETNYRD